MPPPSRRGGRSRSSAFPIELRGTLGTLLRTTIEQARDAIERGAREGRARLDDVRAERRRADAIAELGELVLERARRGELPELEQVPEIADALDALAAMDELEPRDERPAPRRDHVTPERRSRFDGTVSSRDWRPPAPREAGAAEPSPPRKPQAKPKAGGIVFRDDDDDDLGEYMHPDDVPRKG